MRSLAAILNAHRLRSVLILTIAAAAFGGRYSYQHRRILVPPHYVQAEIFAPKVAPLADKLVFDLLTIRFEGSAAALSLGWTNPCPPTSFAWNSPCLGSSTGLATTTSFLPQPPIVPPRRPSASRFTCAWQHWGVLRGGSWADYGPNILQSSYRNVVPSDERDVIYGFRCVLDPGMVRR